MRHAQHRLAFESFGVLAEVLSDDRQLFDLLPSTLPPGWACADGGATAVRRAGPGPGHPVPVPEASIATRPIRASLIAVTHYERSAQWHPTVCTAGEGAMALLEHTVAARSRPGPALSAVGQLSRGARVIGAPLRAARED